MLTRRAIFTKLTGSEKSEPGIIAPPFFLGKFECQDCEAPCVKACHSNLLKFENDIVKFETFGCDFCGDCAKACERGVLDPELEPCIEAVTQINVNACVAWNGVICYNCQDACRGKKAIEFFGMLRPQIKADICDNCGFCVSACFVGAINIKPKPKENE